MIQPSLSQEAFMTMTRASSFHGCPGGDTQPMESQVYRDYTESMARPPTVTAKKTIVEISPDGKINTYDTTATDKTPKTCVEGETGFIDLETAWQPPLPSGRSNSDIEELLASPTTRLQVEDSSDIPLPETPAIAGHKRSRSGEILTSVTSKAKTPGFSQLFGGGGQTGGVLSATQLFNQTQAPSSPLPNVPRSDPVVTRPSPDMQNQFSLSSPTILHTSPIATMKPPATAGEPRDNYTSMRESQERRAAKLREQLGLQKRFSDDLFEEDGDEDEDEDDIHRKRFEHKRLQRVMSDQALHEWAKVHAPSRPGSRLTSSPKLATTIDLITPAATRKGDRLEFDVTDDGNENDDELHNDDDQSGDDEYDELGQTVLRSQSNGHEDEDMNADENETISEQKQKEKDDVQLLKSLPRPRQLHDQSREERQGSHFGTQRSAVADSQPIKQDEGRSLLQQPNVLSSTSSFIPGSQYAGETSQDQAKLARERSKSSTQHQLPPTDPAPDNRVPSSPPVLTASSTVPDRVSEASVARQQMLAEFQQGTKIDHATNDQEIPESDLPVALDGKQGNSQPATINGTYQGASNSLPFFSTAQTHVSASPKKALPRVPPLQNFDSSQHNLTSPSPRTAAGVRHFADIAHAPSPPKASGETELDVDAIMSDVMTADDEQFIQAISSPPRNRPQKIRRLARGSSNGTSLIKSSEAVIPRERPRSEEEPATIFETLPISSALHESLSKANELPEATPRQDEEPTKTPESVKKREEAGAKAISQLVSSRSIRLPKTNKASSKDKITTSNPRQQPSGPTPAGHVKSRLQLKAPSKVKAATLTKSSTFTNGSKIGVDGGSEGAVADSDRGPPAPEPKAAIVSSFRVPTQVFALFKGNYNNFYPATWLGSSADGTEFRVKFLDGNIAWIDKHHVRQLDIQAGDVVKIDASGMRNKTWVVKGFGDVAQFSGEPDGLTDLHGRSVVKIQPKSTRNSMSANSAPPKGEGEEVEVAVTAIYLTHTMWPQFTHRVFIPPAASRSVGSRAATPSTGVQTPNADTPTLRSRRTIVPTAKAIGGKTFHQREESVASTATPTGTAMFSGMAFAISYGSNEAEKADVTRLIQRNGGIVLDSGFEELFSLPSLNESHASPPKKSSRKGSRIEIASGRLQLKPEHENLGFVALIADKHSRRAKYVQALALGLPTLSGRWISDSLDISINRDILQAEATLLPWTKYLLAAGESNYLGGAICSRNLPSYAATDATLSDVIERRELLLNGDGVLIVASKKHKATWERRKAYAFLTLALGAIRVKRVSDLQEAKALAQDDPDTWTWIYVEGSVADAAAVVFGKALTSGKKRKRGEQPTVKVDGNSMCAANGSVKIVNDEFVMQSLILGALVD